MGIYDQCREGGRSRADKMQIGNCIIAVMGRRRAGKSTFVRFVSRDDQLIRGVEGGQVPELISKHNGTKITYAEMPAFDEPLEQIGNAVRNAVMLKAIFRFLVESLQSTPPNQVAGVVFIHNTNQSAAEIPSLDELNLSLMVEIAGREHRNRLDLILNKYGTNVKDDTEIRRTWLRQMERESDPILFDEDQVPAHIVRKILRGDSPVTLKLVDEYLLCGKKLHKTKAGERISSGYETAIQHVAEQIQRLEREKDQLKSNPQNKERRNDVNAEKTRIKDELKLRKGEKKDLVTKQKDWNKR